MITASVPLSPARRRRCAQRSGRQGQCSGAAVGSGRSRRREAALGALFGLDARVFAAFAAVGADHARAARRRTGRSPRRSAAATTARRPSSPCPRIPAATRSSPPAAESRQPSHDRGRRARTADAPRAPASTHDHHREGRATPPNSSRSFPHLLGFRPSRSLVVIPFAASRSLGAMRFDLPDAEPDSTRAVDRVAATVVGMVCRVAEADAADVSRLHRRALRDEGRMPHRDLARRPRASRRRVRPAHDRLAVRGGRRVGLVSRSGVPDAGRRDWRAQQDPADRGIPRRPPGRPDQRCSASRGRPGREGAARAGAREPGARGHGALRARRGDALDRRAAGGSEGSDRADTRPAAWRQRGHPPPTTPAGSTRERSPPVLHARRPADALRRGTRMGPGRPRSRTMPRRSCGACRGPRCATSHWCSGARDSPPATRRSTRSCAGSRARSIPPTSRCTCGARALTRSGPPGRGAANSLAAPQLALRDRRGQVRWRRAPGWRGRSGARPTPRSTRSRRARSTPSTAWPRSSGRSCTPGICRSGRSSDRAKRCR